MESLPSILTKTTSKCEEKSVLPLSPAGKSKLLSPEEAAPSTKLAVDARDDVATKMQTSTRAVDLDGESRDNDATAVKTSSDAGWPNGRNTNVSFQLLKAEIIVDRSKHCLTLRSENASIYQPEPYLTRVQPMPMYFFNVSSLQSVADAHAAPRDQHSISSVSEHL